jgi:hypothetical protein
MIILWHCEKEGECWMQYMTFSRHRLLWTKYVMYSYIKHFSDCLWKFIPAWTTWTELSAILLPFLALSHILSGYRWCVCVCVCVCVCWCARMSTYTILLSISLVLEFKMPPVFESEFLGKNYKGAYSYSSNLRLTSIFLWEKTFKMCILYSK